MDIEQDDRHAVSTSFCRRSGGLPGGTLGIDKVKFSVICDPEAVDPQNALVWGLSTKSTKKWVENLPTGWLKTAHGIDTAVITVALYMPKMKAWVEFNPSRLLDPLGYSLASLDETLTVTDSLLEKSLPTSP